LENESSQSPLCRWNGESEGGKGDEKDTVFKRHCGNLRHENYPQSNGLELKKGKLKLRLRITAKAFSLAQFPQ
jgi:hypothetical protein